MKNRLFIYVSMVVMTVLGITLISSCTKDPVFEQGDYLYQYEDFKKVDYVNGIVINWSDNMEITEEQKSVIKNLFANLVYVKGGTFLMGAQHTNPNDIQYDAGAQDNESPVHEVSLSDYYIGKFEITQREWRAVMGYDLNWSEVYGKGDRIPAYNVTRSNAIDFLNKLSQMTRLSFQLPTEAQWEFAARGGNSTQQFRYSGGNDVNAVAWHKNNAGHKLHNVGEKQANELGLHDMSGSLWEWCRDRYNTYPSESQQNPCNILGNTWVLRGGSWTYLPSFCRVTCRDTYTDDRSVANGFRVVLPIQ